VVRAGKLWGGRFAAGTADSVEAFTASIDVDSRLYRHDIAGSIAHAKMLARQRIIPARDAQKIVRGLKTIEREIDAGKFAFSSADEDIHMNIERRLSETRAFSQTNCHRGARSSFSAALPRENMSMFCWPVLATGSDFPLTSLVAAT